MRLHDTLDVYINAEETSHYTNTFSTRIFRSPPTSSCFNVLGSVQFRMHLDTRISAPLSYPPQIAYSPGPYTITQTSS